MADPHGAARGRRRRRARSSTSGCPRRSSTWPRPSSTWPRRRSPTAPRSASGTPASDVREGRLGEVPAHLRDATTRARRRSATATATTTLTTTRGAGCPSATCPPSSPTARYYEPGRHGFEAEVARRQETRRDEGEARQDRRTARTRSAGPRADRFRHATPPRVACSAGRTGYGRAVTAGELAIVLGTVLCVARLRGLIVVLVRVLDALKDLRAEVEDLRARDRTAPRRAARVRRRGAATTSSASTGCSARPRRSRRNVRGRLPGGPGRAVSTPVIKTVALASGTSKAARRLRRKEVSR